MCPGPQGMFWLWHFWSSLTPQQHFQDFSWNWETDIKFAAICAKQLFLSVTLDAWYTHQGKQSRATSQGHAVSVGPPLLWLKFVEAPSVPTTKSTFFLFVVWSPSSQSNIFFTCDIATCPWLCKVCTTYNREWSSSKFLHYLAHSREQTQKLKLSHTESCLQCKAQGVFIVQMPIMKSTQISPRAFSSKINAKAFIHNEMFFSKA